MEGQVNFFATRMDLLSVTAAVEAQRTMKYICRDDSNGGKFEEFDSASEIPDLGIAIHGDHNLDSIFLVLDRNKRLIVEQINLKAGGTSYSIDQSANPSSVTFQPGGVYGDQAVISGRVATCRNDPVSLALLKLFRKEIKRRFERFKISWVGPEAAGLLDAGRRFTFSVRAPTVSDLTREEVPVQDA